MKKTVAILAFLICTIFSLDSNAQKIGVFLGYGTEVEELGLGLNGEFGVSDRIAIQPSFVYWFPEEPFTWWEFNANVNYYFVTEGTADFYGLAGINLFKYNVDIDGVDGESEVGLNLGAGANFDIGKSWEPFTELKFVIGDADQLGLFFGVKFKLND